MVYFTSRLRILQGKSKNDSPQSEICHHLPVGYSHIKVTEMFVESLGLKKQFWFLLRCSLFQALAGWRRGKKEGERAKKKRVRTKARNGERALPSFPRLSPPLFFLSLAFFLRSSLTTESLEQAT